MGSDLLLASDQTAALHPAWTFVKSAAAELSPSYATIAVCLHQKKTRRKHRSRRVSIGTMSLPPEKARRRSKRNRADQGARGEATEAYDCTPQGAETEHRARRKQ